MGEAVEFSVPTVTYGKVLVGTLIASTFMSSSGHSGRQHNRTGTRPLHFVGLPQM